MNSKYFNVHLHPDKEISSTDKEKLCSKLTDVSVKKNDKGAYILCPKYDTEVQIPAIFGGSCQTFTSDTFDMTYGSGRIKDLNWRLYFTETHLGVISWLETIAETCLKFIKDKYQEEDDLERSFMSKIFKAIKTRCSGVREQKPGTKMFNVSINMSECRGHLRPDKTVDTVCRSIWENRLKKERSLPRYAADSEFDIGTVCALTVKILNVHMDTPKSWKDGTNPNYDYTPSNLKSGDMTIMRKHPWWEKIYLPEKQRMQNVDNVRCMCTLRSIYYYYNKEDQQPKIAIYTTMNDAVVTEKLFGQEPVNVGTIGLMPSTSNSDLDDDDEERKCFSGQGQSRKRQKIEDCFDSILENE